MSKFLLISKVIVAFAFFLFMANILEIAESQKWSSEISPITNWERVWEAILFIVLAFNYHRLSVKAERQDKVIMDLRREFYDTRDLRANYTIQHSERISNIEYKIGLR